ncbi:MAG: hypothetical protein MJ240_14540, partial [Kiritimatiellae bacterium]|nr:hypothetical protein [Kiritimatiellia bacterium]
MERLKETLFCALALMGMVLSADVTLSNAQVALVLGDDGCAKSLKLKANGEELLDNREHLPFFSVMQERPFDNELKLAFPNTRTVYPATSLRQEGARLIVGFERKSYEAEVEVKITDDYLAFRLVGFRLSEDSIYRRLSMDAPAAAAFRVAQLPLRPRRNFGEWLNVVHDEKACVALVGAVPEAEVGSEQRGGARVLHVDALSAVKLEGVWAALVADRSTDRFMDRMDALERDFDLPRGVQSRRNPLLNASIYWANDVVPTNVEEHIAFAKQGGFRMMLLYYLSVVDGKGFPSYTTLPDYEDLRPEFPNGLADIKAMLAKIKAAGITPGIHTLQTHVGFKSRYVTPVADPRLNLKRRFTLAQDLPEAAEGDELQVYENPAGVPMAKGCRILQFGGEMISYTNYVATRPYRFTGVVRGHLNTHRQAHPRGQIGGILDVSEYGARSCYLDQRTDLQDEVAEKFAKIWNCGFEFAYFDGSEGVNAPCGVYVALAQWRMTRQFAYPPLFTEGAAKSHFGWHLQAGANAFDMFDPSHFKAKIVAHPLAEAPLMRMDFTRVDFGWWGITPPGIFEYRTKRKNSLGTQPDMWEYGSSKAAAWDCPATVKIYGLAATKRIPRINDLFTTLRRWEDVRMRRLLTSEQKEMLKDPEREFHLVPNSAGAYDLVEWRQLAVAGSKDADVRAFVFTREGRLTVAYWHCRGQGTLVLADGTRLAADNMREWVT